jgi:Flp pilus assembly protein TadD
VPYHYLGFAHFLRRRNAEAAAAWETAARKRMTTQEVAESLENIGLAHLNAGQWQKALDNSEVVLLVHPVEDETPWNALMRGIALAELGREGEAELAFAQWRKGGDDGDVYALRQYLDADLHEYVTLEPALR